MAQFGVKLDVKISEEMNDYLEDLMKKSKGLKNKSFFVREAIAEYIEKIKEES